MKRSMEQVSIENETESDKKISKHTLDSDEELEDVDGQLNYEDVQGQEPNTLEYDGEIKITPFNMREELEDDGHFDKNGTFIFKKVNEIGDNWLEDIDWAAVKRNEVQTGNSQHTEKQKAVNLAAENDKLPTITTDDRLKLYKELLTFMLSKETVLRTLKRIGPKKPQQRRWGRRKDGTIAEKESDSIGAETANFARLTELADDLLGSGDFDIYQKTKEVIEDFVLTAEAVGEEDELDAFGAALDDAVGLDVKECDARASTISTEIKWLMKKGRADADTVVEGPFSNEDLKNLIKNSTFPDPSIIFLRRQGADEEPFRALNTIDAVNFT